MTWVRKDDAGPLHPKFFRAGLAAYGLFDACLCYSNRLLTDGWVPAKDIRLIFPGATPAEVELAIEALVREGLLETQNEGWFIHDYFDYQPRRRDVLKKRRVRSEAGRQGGLRSAERRKQIASHMVEANGKHGASHAANPRPDPTRPVPEVLKDLTTLSGNEPDTASLNGKHSFKAEARDVLSWLNEKAGKRFESNETNLAFIEARLREGRPVWLLKKLVSVKCKAWGADEKMREFLRPATLFNKTKCSQYIGELPVGSEPA